MNGTYIYYGYSVTLRAIDKSDGRVDVFPDISRQKINTHSFTFLEISPQFAGFYSTDHNSESNKDSNKNAIEHFIKYKIVFNMIHRRT